MVRRAYLRGDTPSATIALQMKDLETNPHTERVERSHESAAKPVEFASVKPENVRLSSRGLGWRPLNFERREAAPDSDCLPAGSTEHLVFVNLAPGHVQRQAEGTLIEQQLVPGSVAVQPGGQSVCWSWDTRLSFSVMSLEPAFLDRVAKEVFDLDPDDYQLLVSAREQDPVVSNIAGVLAREVVRAEVGGKLYAESLANILAVHLLRNYSSRAGAAAASEDRQAPAPAHRSRAVADAINFIQSNYAHDVKLEDVAAAVHLSPFHLARLFKQVTGSSPHQYLVQVRVNAARSLLSAGSGQRSLADVAAAVGFADQSHLTRQFKRHFGVTPSQFR
jgi:AraC family transcriptional regulator